MWTEPNEFGRPEIVSLAVGILVDSEPLRMREVGSGPGRWFVGALVALLVLLMFPFVFPG